VYSSANSNGLLELNSRIEKLHMGKSHIEGDVTDL
jgi:predicted transcriptional regulator